MGYRLTGPRYPAGHPTGEMISDATFTGAIQVPPSGEPILLMADRQTTGGYPQIATVITADLPLAGQLAPGDWIEFEICSRAERLPPSPCRKGASVRSDDAVVGDGAEPRAGVPLAVLTRSASAGPARWFVRARRPATSPRLHQWCAERGAAAARARRRQQRRHRRRGVDGWCCTSRFADATFTARWRGRLVAAGAGEPWDALVRGRGRARAGRARMPVRHSRQRRRHADPERRRLRPGGRRPRSNGLRVYDRQSLRRCATLPAAECGFVVPDEPVQGRRCRALHRVRRHLPAACRACRRRRIRTCIAYLERARHRDADGRRRAGGGARDPAAQGHGARPGRSGYAQRRVVLHEPGRDPAHREQIAAAAGREAPGFPAGAGRVKVPAAWLIEQAGFARGLRRRRGRDLEQASAGAGRIAAARRRPTCCVSPRASSGASLDRFSVCVAAGADVRRLRRRA